MINWTEEDVKFICNNMLIPISDQIMKAVEQNDKLHEEYYSKIFDMLINKIKDITYAQQRENAFLKQILIQHLHLNVDKFNETYIQYCKDYDELNQDKK